MKPTDWGTTDIRLTKALSLNVEWTYYAESVSADRDVPSEPAIYEIETVWLFEEITEAIIDVTDLEGTLWKHDDVLQIVEGGKR